MFLAIFTLTLLLAKPTAHLLSVYIGIGGCEYPIFLSVRRYVARENALCIYRTYSASVADATITGVNVEKVIKEWLKAVGSAALPRYWKPPVTLPELGRERQDASKWAHNSIPEGQ